MKRYVFFPYPGRNDQDEFVVTVEDEATMLITDVSTEAGRVIIDMVTKARGLKQTVPIVARQLQVNWIVDEADDDDDVEKGDGQPPSKGVVVVAIPSNQAGIAVDGGLVPSEVHATLGYYGDVDELHDDLIERLKKFVDMHSMGFSARVGGVAAMGNDDPQAVALLIEAPELQSLRDALEAWAPMDMKHPHFSPHVTLGYGIPMPTNKPEGIHFDRIELWYGGVHYTRPSGKTVILKEEFQIGEVGELSKLDVDKRLVFGWAYVTHDKQGNVSVDKSGEFVDDYTDLEDAVYDFVIKSRVSGDMHQQDGGKVVQVGTMVESMMFTPEKLGKMGLPPGILPTGWWVGFRVDNDSVWKDVKEGRRLQFSIHGSGKREVIEA